MEDAPQPVSPATLKYLRILVTGLTVTMIAGLLVIIALFVIRFGDTGTPAALPLPENITLPGGASPVAVTAAPTWYGVVTQEDRILIFDRRTGDLLQEVQINAPD